MNGGRGLSGVTREKDVSSNMFSGSPTFESLKMVTHSTLQINEVNLRSWQMISGCIKAVKST